MTDMKHGFTLVELVLVIALLGVLSIVLGPSIQESVQGYDMVWTRRQVIAQARAGMDRMTAEIQLIPGSSSIVNIGSSTSFTFRYPSSYQIRYRLNGGYIQRNSYNLIEHVSALSFIYYNEDGNTTSNPNQVRSVGIQFTIDPQTVIPTYTLRTRVFLRNTGNEITGFDVQ